MGDSGLVGSEVDVMAIWILLKLFSLVYYGIDKGALKEMHEFMQEVNMAKLLVPSGAPQGHPWGLPSSAATCGKTPEPPRGRGNSTLNGTSDFRFEYLCFLLCSLFYYQSISMKNGQIAWKKTICEN